MSVKNKIYLTVILWLALSGAMFLYGFKIFSGSNQAALDQISKEKQQMMVLQNEEDSYRLAQKDVQEMAKKQIQPADFFNQDINLVKEIEELEKLGKDTGVSLSLGGISGTINSVPKAKAQGQLFVVPYNIAITGTLPQVVGFIETLENMDFITTLNSLSLSSAGNGNVSASMAANFYIRKK